MHRSRLPHPRIAVPALFALAGSACAVDGGDVGAQAASRLEGASEITGWVDSVTSVGGTAIVSGWACALGLDQSVAVHVWRDAPAGVAGTGMAQGTANLPSEPAVAEACHAHGTNYRFRVPIPMSAADTVALSRHAIFVHGISPVGLEHRVLGNSGNVTLPGFAGPITHDGIVVHTENHTSSLSSLMKNGYAPSILRINDTYHMWYCSEPAQLPNGDQWGMDSIRYATSSDGRSWSTPLQVVKVGPGNAYDTERSTCDPSVVAWNGAYYMFYGGNRRGVTGVIFVARADSPQGPWLKLTERGTWEENAPDPKAIVTPRNPVLEVDLPIFYGAGQPTVVVKDGKLNMWFYDDTECYVAGTHYVDPTVHTPNGNPGPTPIALQHLNCNPNKHYLSTSYDPASWPTPTITELPAEVVTWDDSAKVYRGVVVGSGHTPLAYFGQTFSTDGVRWSPLHKVGDLEGWTHNIGIATDARGFLLQRGVVDMTYGAPRNFANSFSNGNWDLAAAKAYEAIPLAGDFDGDGFADPALIDPQNGTLYTANTVNGLVSEFPRIISTDRRRTAIGDFNGDGVTDRLVVDDSTPGGSSWYVIDGRTGAQGVPEIPWGWQFGGMVGENRLALGDYDGDGKTDRAIVSDDPGGSRWYIVPSTLGYGGAGTAVVPWGWQFGGMTASATLALGDYDGDGKTDAAIVDLNTGGGPSFYIVPSTLGYGGAGVPGIPWGWQWQGPAGRLALGDFDGDRRTDIAFVDEGDRNGSRWYVRPSSSGYAPVGTAAIGWGSQLGGSGPDTTLVLGDYDHDGKMDRAVVTRDCRYRIESSSTGGMGARNITWDWQLRAPTCVASSP